MRGVVFGLSAVAVLSLAGAFFSSVSADRFSGGSYIIDASVLGGTGGLRTGTGYQLTSSAGENVIGNGAGGSYKVGMGYAAQLDKSLQLTVQPNGLVSYYSMDGTYSAGSVLLNSAATAAPAVQSTNGATATTGKVSGAQQFNGSSKYFGESSGDTSYDGVTNTAGTIEFWVKSSTTGVNQFLVSREGGCMGWQSKIDTTGHIFAQISSTTGGCGAAVYTSATSTSTVTDGAWHHVAMTINRSTQTIKVYIDGVQAGSTNTIPVGAPASGGTLKIGADYAGANLFNGSLDEIKIFNRELRADEIKADYTAENSGVTSGVSLGAITPGVSNTALVDVITQTDAGGYTLAINQDHDLTVSSYTIPAISPGSIASPAAWTEGSTKGFGFTLTATNGTAITAGWASGANYAAFPASATTFYTRTGIPSSNDYLTMKLRADVSSAKASLPSSYTNTITVTGTLTP
jgi:hypothetical protein